MLARGVVAALATLSVGCNAAPNAAVSCAALARPPVIMVHGSGLGPASWRPLVAALRRAGYADEQLSALALEPNDGDNVRAATETIARAVDERLAATQRLAAARGCPAKPQRVDLVAHSMGAVSSRWYAAFVRPERVRILIGIAPSNHGTDALCGLSGEGNAQMCPSYDQAPTGLQAKLNGTRASPRDETPYGLGADARVAERVAPNAERAIAYFTVRLRVDRWIEPPESAVLDGAGGLRWDSLPAHANMTTDGNVLWGRAVDHDALPQDPELIGAVVNLLTTAP